MKKICVFLLGVVLLIPGKNALALENGLARTPPMGFNTWNWFGCGDRNRGAISDTLIRKIADAMVTNGMKEAGYQYVNIDDCWGESSRNASGGIVASRTNFPNGMKVVADYVHSKGLKLGLYTDVAAQTCAKTMPGTYGHETQDADSLVAWGIDYVKVDWCGGDQLGQPIPMYTKVRNALRSAVTRMKPTVPTAHELVYSICNWGGSSPWTWGDTIGNLWRTTGDIDYNNFCQGFPCWGGILSNMDGTADRAKYAGPGHWNDADMMEIGNQATTLAEDRSHFSLWCMMASPLIAGNDIRNMSAPIKAILTNPEAIKVDQDSLGKQGIRVTPGDAEVWVRKLSSITAVRTDTNYAVLFFNRNNGGAMSLTSTQIATAVGGGIQNGKVYKVRNLWTHTDLPDWTAGTPLVPPAAVPNHDVVMLRLSPVPTGSNIGLSKSSKNEWMKIVGKNITVNPGSSGRHMVSLVGLNGKVVYSHQFFSAGQFTFATDGLNRGIYYIKLSGSGESLIRRVLLK